MAETIQKTLFFLKFRRFPEVLEGRIFPISRTLSRFFRKFQVSRPYFFVNLDFFRVQDPRKSNGKVRFCRSRQKFQDLQIPDFLDPDPGFQDPILSVQTNFWISGFSDRGSRDLNFVDPDNFFRFPDPGSDLVGLDQFLDFWISGFSDRGSRDLNFVDLDKFFGFFLIFF